MSNTRSFLAHGIRGAALGGLLVSSLAHASLTELADNEMAAVSGQALFLVDKIPGNLTGSDSLSTPFTFYRLGIDGDMYLNLNVDKMQLGCGGFNEGIAANACDMDADYVTLSGTTNNNGPTSDFLMRRPYMELAIKNDGDKTRREIVGVKIGAQAAIGLMTLGRVYQNGQVNQEWGGTCNAAYGQPTDNGSRLACHTGANRISGFMNAELSGRSLITAVGLTTTGICFGWSRANTGDPCGPSRQQFVAVAGTRMSEIAARNLTLYLDNAVLGISSGKLDLTEKLRFLHRVEMGEENKDFFLSFQRERVRWPIYDYNAPYDTDRLFPIGTNQNGDTTNRSYHYPANTGWWMNIQDAQILDAYAGHIQLGLGDLISTLGEGANLNDFETGMIPQDNCFGTQVFC
jgi:hypothetical protein